jgi:chaperonin GroEL (HSP60 family)
VRTQNDDQKTGVESVRKALSAPACQIATNAGEDGSVIVGKISPMTYVGLSGFGIEIAGTELVEG